MEYVDQSNVSEYCKCIRSTGIDRRIQRVDLRDSDEGAWAFFWPTLYVIKRNTWECFRYRLVLCVGFWEIRVGVGRIDHDAPGDSSEADERW